MMKKIISLFFICISALCFSQSDTLYLLSNKKITCKILEINDLEIKYRPVENSSGPLYIIDKSTVYKYSLSNGFSEQITKRETQVWNNTPVEATRKEVKDNYQSIKLSPFSFAFSHVSLAYEKVIKKGMNAEVTVGYSNSGINPDEMDLFKTGYNKGSNYTGAFIKPGIKFFFGEEYSDKNIKYAHPLSGRYIKLDLALSYLNAKNLTAVYSMYTSTTGVVSQTTTSNLTTIAYGGFVNYGRQVILGNILTLEGYIGVGFTGKSETYSNPSFFISPFPQSVYTQDNNSYTSNYHGFLRIPTLGLSFAGGFNIGYIIPQKSKNKKAVKK